MKGYEMVEVELAKVNLHSQNDTLIHKNIAMKLEQTENLLKA